MDFDLTDDRRMLNDTLNRYLEAQYPLSARNAVAYQAPFHDPNKWSAMAQLGVLYALADAASGGMGGTGFDITTLFEPLGRTLCPEPFLAALLAARLLASAGQPLEDLLSGQVTYAVGYDEPDMRGALEDLQTLAISDPQGWHLTGRKSVVYGAGVAGRLLIVARLPDGLPGLFEMAAGCAQITPFGMIDGGAAGEVFLEASPATLILRDARAALADALDAGALALCAEALGAMDVTALTVLEYLKTRKQFGRRIGDFQALQHRMVDLMAQIEQARSITIFAASRMGTGDQSRAVSMAKTLIGQTARQVAEEAIQMQGGIAMTWEHETSHFAKRLVMIDHQLGDTDQHLARVIAGLQAPSG
ncbi:MAG: alkylation response protein AidB-like acyl-CoA dehydrogenase [Paracoccaceae bacterium]|jgi:alkylation response protein AidB-like acyl-CoA dehydrogenase